MVGSGRCRCIRHRGHGYGGDNRDALGSRLLSCLAGEDRIELALREAGFCAVVRQAEVLLVYSNRRGPGGYVKLVCVLMAMPATTVGG